MTAPRRLTLGAAADAELVDRCEATDAAETRIRYQLLVLRAAAGDRLVRVCTPTYDPDANRSAWLGRRLRRPVTHTHRREALDPLLADANAWARDLPPDRALRQLGSPFASDAHDPQQLDLAA